jgi:hypothetical protein
MDAQGGLRLHGIALGAILALMGTPRADVVTATAQNDAVKVTAHGGSSTGRENEWAAGL